MPVADSVAAAAAVHAARAVLAAHEVLVAAVHLPCCQQFHVSIERAADLGSDVAAADSGDVAAVRISADLAADSCLFLPDYPAVG